MFRSFLGWKPDKISCHSDSTERQLAYTGVKNLQDV